ncbi:Transaldolase [Trichuris trichiura]|uniref:Transaldolase n=1 Tax=Trichuris trichiura TaxID=36087 RepID=A0A077ZF95_TRITR|nr:Transaldolase [Trichuris trichiura]
MEPQNSWTYLLPAGDVNVMVRVRLEKTYNRLVPSAVDSSARLPAKESVKADVSSVDVEEYTFRWLEEKSLQVSFFTFSVTRFI